MAQGSLASQYVEERMSRRNKPAAWVRGTPPFDADEIDLAHLQDAHFPALGHVAVFKDGSVAVRESTARFAGWLAVPERGCGPHISGQDGRVSID